MLEHAKAQLTTNIIFKETSFEFIAKTGVGKLTAKIVLCNTRSCIQTMVIDNKNIVCKCAIVPFNLYFTSQGRDNYRIHQFQYFT